MHTILIVEDDPAVAEMLAAILEDEGYGVLQAPDGDAALALLASEACDLVITDLMMPRRDGRALRTSLAADPALQRLPVVLMTAATNLTAQDRQAFDAVLTKPFPLESVLATIVACTKRQQRTV